MRPQQKLPILQQPILVLRQVATLNDAGEFQLSRGFDVFSAGNVRLGGISVTEALPGENSLLLQCNGRSERVTFETVLTLHDNDLRPLLTAIEGSDSRLKGIQIVGVQNIGNVAPLYQRFGSVDFDENRSSDTASTYAKGYPYAIYVDIAVPGGGNEPVAKGIRGAVKAEQRGDVAIFQLLDERGARRNVRIQSTTNDLRNQAEEPEGHWSGLDQYEIRVDVHRALTGAHTRAVAFGVALAWAGHSLGLQRHTERVADNDILGPPPGAVLGSP